MVKEVLSKTTGWAKLPCSLLWGQPIHLHVEMLDLLQDCSVLKGNNYELFFFVMPTATSLKT